MLSESNLLLLIHRSEFMLGSSADLKLLQSHRNGLASTTLGRGTSRTPPLQDVYLLNGQKTDSGLSRRSLNRKTLLT